MKCSGNATANNSRELVGEGLKGHNVVLIIGPEANKIVPNRFPNLQSTRSDAYLTRDLQVGWVISYIVMGSFSVRVHSASGYAKGPFKLPTN